MSTKLPNLSLWERIRAGFDAERKFIKAYRDEASLIILKTYKVPDSHLGVLIKRTLKATINTIRRHKWQPNLIRRMVQSQVLVFRWQTGKITDKDLQKIQGTLIRFVRHNMGKRMPGGLTMRQENVCEEAYEVFRKKVTDPNFVLTSNLDTYLLGIAYNLIKSFDRRQRRGPANSPFTEISTANGTHHPDDVILLEKIRFYRQSHRLIARQLGLLDDKCLAIILDHYGIDPSRLEADGESSEADETMTQAEFDALFRVAGGTAGESYKLKDIAIKLGISPKKISQRHLDCVDRLVQRVLPELLENETTSFSQTARQEMIARLTEARIRQQNR